MQVPPYDVTHVLPLLQVNDPTQLQLHNRVFFFNDLNWFAKREPISDNYADSVNGRQIVWICDDNAVVYGRDDWL